ncbi:hypothetical protein FHS68_001721 [Dyadobacter arcticus]|uniref:Uncharacterized protein n=1 Tax=Dyadobacter arcticus TaxID=1078754 RepID=A0ABX0UN90_9BACT|nr:hypothetical protein [Dyadobacter arcticus]
MSANSSAISLVRRIYVQFFIIGLQETILFPYHITNKFTGPGNMNQCLYFPINCLYRPDLSYILKPLSELKPVHNFRPVNQSMALLKY